MSRIARRFAQLKADKRAGLVTYVSAGDPNVDISYQILKGLPGTLSLLADCGFSDDEALRWLFTDDKLPGSPVQALAENRGTEVKRRAQALAL